MSNQTVAHPSAQTIVAEMIEAAYEAGKDRETARVASAARWAERTGWRLEPAHFEELLSERTSSEAERFALRGFRARLVAERCAA